MLLWLRNTTLANLVASDQEYVWFKVADGAGSEAEEENKEKLL